MGMYLDLLLFNTADGDLHISFRFMLNDPAVWGDPENFRPERFLLEHNPKANDLPDPTLVIFGFGIRSVISFHDPRRPSGPSTIFPVSLFFSPAY
jgi:hypothetical protein